MTTPLENTPDLWREHYPVPAAGGHKYHRGHTVVLSGGPTSTGAARLAARAALRSGSGLVTLLSPPSAILVNAAHLTAVMLRKVDGPSELAETLEDARITTVIAGPALGAGAKAARTAELIETILNSGKDCLLDADALTAFADDPQRLFSLMQASTGQCVLTPHMGEFNALFGDIVAEDNRLPRATEAAKLSNATIVLKGPGTLVAQPNGPVSICHSAPPWLATAGSGDVLAGIIGGLLAQGMPAFHAASAGVWLHGEAANIEGPGLIAEDLDTGLKVAIGQLLSN